MFDPSFLVRAPIKTVMATDRWSQFDGLTFAVLVDVKTSKTSDMDLQLISEEFLYLDPIIDLWLAQLNL